MQIYMHCWEISIIFFCPGNLGGDLRTTVKQKALSEKKVPFDFVSQYFTILHLKSFKNDLKKPKKACM